MSTLTQQGKLLMFVTASWILSPLFLLLSGGSSVGSGLGDFWNIWGVCAGFITITIGIYIYQERKLLALKSKEIATLSPFNSQIKGLAWFILFMILLVETAYISLKGNFYSTAYYPAFIPSFDIFHIDPNDSGTYRTRIIFGWIYATIGMGAFVGFSCENWASKLIVTKKNELLFGLQSQEESNNNSDGADDDSTLETQSTETSQLDRPATYNDIIAAMEAQLQEAIKVAEILEEELVETKAKVVDLEVEVKKREEEISQIQDYKVEVNKFVSERGKESDDSGKNLSLTDSVMVGDSIMGGVKIDKQINNDPEAIVKAIIEAYRHGLND